MEEEFMNFFSLPSLESIARVNVVIAVFKQSNIRNDMIKHLSKRSGIEIEESSVHLEKSVIQNVSHLPFPPLLKAEVVNIITPITSQILKWIRNPMNSEYVDCIRWTVEGTIDKENTLKRLIDRDSGQNSLINYVLACHYCLKDCISKAWNKLPEENKKHYRSSSYPYRQYYTHLIAYWNHVVRKELPDLLNKLKTYDERNIYNCNESISKNMFALSLVIGNIMAVKYFWKKLTVNEISRNLVHWVDDVLEILKKQTIKFQETNRYCDILFFLLSQMNDSRKQRQIFQKHSVILELLFLVWPWQRFLLPILQLMVDYFDLNSYISLWSLVGKEMKENKITVKLFRKIWNISPISFRNFFIQKSASSLSSLYRRYHAEELLCNLLLVEDTETVEEFLAHANSEERKILVFKAMKSHSLSTVIYRNKLSLLDMLLETTLESEQEVINTKEKIIWKHSDVWYWWIRDGDFKMIEQFVDWGLECPNKINSFKNKINKNEIVYTLLKDKRKCKFVDKFLNWCYVSQEEVNAFKKNFSLSKYKIVQIAEGDWFFFQKFIEWCFCCEEDIEIFKQRIIEDYTMMYY